MKIKAFQTVIHLYDPAKSPPGNSPKERLVAKQKATKFGLNL
jgi:hypothetical protein